MSGPGDLWLEDYGWNSMVGIICRKGVLSLEWKRKGVMDGESGDADENGDLAWLRKWNSEAEIERCGWGSRNDSGSWFQSLDAKYRKNH